MSANATVNPEVTSSKVSTERQFGLPTVRSISLVTAHPSEEAWPAPATGTRSGSAAGGPSRARRLRPQAVRRAAPRREVGFDELQRRLPAVYAATGAGRMNRSVVVVPSRVIDKWCEPAAVTQAYEERLLCSLLSLRDPSLRMTYVTSSPIPSWVVEYHLSLLPRAMRASARSRLTLVALGDASDRPLSEKLLERPRVLNRIRDSIPDERLCYLSPFQTIGADRDVAVALGIPLYGADPRHEPLGSKSGCRTLFAETGVPHPAGAEHVTSVESVVDAIIALRSSRRDLSQLVLKLDRGVSGEGNAIVDVAGLPDPGAEDEALEIRGRLAALAPEAPGVSVEAFLRKLAVGGGIIEERITGCELRSPSVQIQITPDGEVILVSTHDQLLGGENGQSYLGCRFPAESSYAAMISDLARRIGERLAALGVIGRLAVDFVVARDRQRAWRPYAIEINLRKGGTTHPYDTFALLTGGSYDAATATFQTPTGVCKHYVATDHLESPALTALGHSGTLALTRCPELRFDRMRRTGTAFHMLSSIDECGRTGFTAIADSAEQADAAYELASTTVLNAAADAARHHMPELPVALAA